MDNDHWFDALNKALVRDAPRRAMLGAAAAVVAGIALGPAPGIVARPRGRPVNRDRKKDKGKKNGKKKDKGKPKPTPSCSGGVCTLEWAGDQDGIDYCEFVCEQCDGADPRQFCILKPSSGDKVAWCCEEDQECCGNWCCLTGDYCCDPGEDRRPTCLTDEQQCCPDDAEYGWCALATHICCPGVGCVEDLECPDDEPDNECGGSCDDVGAGLECCDGACVDTTVNWRHCGGCGQECEGGLWARCCDSACVDSRFDDDHCGALCLDCPTSDPKCCHGRCHDPETSVCCRDHDTGSPLCANPCVCCTTPDGAGSCCCP